MNDPIILSLVFGGVISIAAGLLYIYFPKNKKKRKNNKKKKSKKNRVPKEKVSIKTIVALLPTERQLEAIRPKVKTVNSVEGEYIRKEVMKIDEDNTDGTVQVVRDWLKQRPLKYHKLNREDPESS